MVSAVRLGNAAAVVFSLITTYIGIKIVGAVSPAITGSKEEIGVLLSLPLMATPVLYTTANRFCQKTFLKSAPQNDGPSRVVSALAVASGLAIAMQLIAFVTGFVSGFIQLMTMTPEAYAEASRDMTGQMLAAAPFLYICLAILAGLAGIWLARRHTAVPTGMMLLAIGIFWFINTLVNYVLMTQPGMTPPTAMDPTHPIMRIAMFIGIMIGGIIPALWLWLWMGLGGKYHRNRLAAQANKVDSGEGI